MEILYDHQAFSLQKFGGVSRIFSELISSINAGNKHHAHLSLFFSNNAHLKEKNIPFVPFFPNTNMPKKAAIMYKMNEYKSAYDLKNRRVDIYHPTYYNPFLVRYCSGAKVVVTVHDMIHEKFITMFPELCADRSVIQQKKDLIAKADHIIAVSENTSRDLQELLGINPSKITVIYLGNSVLTKPQINKGKEPYLLFVGNRGAYKNFVFMLEAIADLLLVEGIKLVCAGSHGFSEEECIKIQKLKLEKHVSHTSVSDSKLAELYANAIAFIFPSLYEGFGIPILEAFSCNCPCLLSNTSSLPEVAGDAALYFAPNDKESIYETVKLAISDSNLRHELIIKGQLRLNRFSWVKHVSQTCDVYDNEL